MKVSRGYLYGALAVTAAVAYGVWVGPYWIADALVLAAAGGAVVYFSSKEGGVDHVLELLTFWRLASRASRLQGTKTSVTERNQKERIPRSRIAHYVTVSRIKSTASIAKKSDSPFERALLSRPEWRTLSGGSLEEVTMMVPSALVEIAQ